MKYGRRSVEIGWVLIIKLITDESWNVQWICSTKLDFAKPNAEIGQKGPQWLYYYLSSAQKIVHVKHTSAYEYFKNFSPTSVKLQLHHICHCNEQQISVKVLSIT